MKIKNFLSFVFAAALLFVLSSCGHYSDGTSINAGGAVVIPILGGLGLLISGYYLISIYLRTKVIHKFSALAVFISIAVIVVYFIVQNASK